MTCHAMDHHGLAALREAVGSDVRRYLTKSPHDLARGDSFKTRLSAGLTPEVLPVVCYRVAHYLHANGWRRTAVLASRLNHMIHKVYITPQSCIGPGLRLPHPAGVAFHGRAGSSLTLYSMAICCPADWCWDGSTENAPLLGDSVTIAAHAVVLGPVAVGSGTTVAHGVQLAQDAPEGVLVSSRAMRVSIRRHVEPAAEATPET